MLEVHAKSTSKEVQLRHYYIECYFCDEETQVSATTEPEFCPLCGEEVNADVIDELDSDE